MNKKRKLSLSLSLFLLLLSLSSSLSLSNADVLHTLSHKRSAFTRHHRIQRQERVRSLPSPERNVNIQKEKRKCAKLSLSHFSTLIFLPLLHILSLRFMLSYIKDIWTHTLLKEGCQCPNIHPISSRQQSPLIVSVCLSRI